MLWIAWSAAFARNHTESEGAPARGPRVRTIRAAARRRVDWSQPASRPAPDVRVLLALQVLGGRWSPRPTPHVDHMDDLRVVVDGKEDSVDVRFRL
jgi:hypothetical protein